jgi:alpha-1,2-mannosyltransferase
LVRLSAVLLLWEPFVSNIFLGQSSLSVSVLTISGFLLLQANRDRTAGLCFGVATLMKLYPGLLILYLLLQRRRRCLTVFVAIVGSGFLCSALLLGDAIAHYFRVVVAEQAQLFAAYPLNVSLGAAVRSIFEPTYFSAPFISAPLAGDLFVWALSGSIVGSIVLFAYFHRAQELSADLFALFCIATLLVSPITWVHYCTLLLFPMAVLLHDAISRKCQASVKHLLWSAILCGVPLQDLIDGIREHYGSDQLAWYVILGVKTALYGLILLYCIFWQRLARTAGYVSVWQLFGSLRRRNVRAYFIQ